jgi:hypothetical protein
MRDFRPLLGAVFAVVPLGSALAAPAQPGVFNCPQCPVQSRAPSAKEKGQFDYRLKCTDADNGNTVVLDITARNERDALHIAWTSPRLDEAIVGMELNGYACAEPPPRAK